jgi:hypothetical protein
MRRSITDWLDEARTADGVSRERAMDEAVALVGSAWEWLAVLRGAAAIEGVGRERLREVADMTLRRTSGFYNPIFGHRTRGC